MNIRKQCNPLSIIFQEEGHQYYSEFNKKHTSVTTFLKQYQVPFPDSAVHTYAKKHNRTVEDVQAEWDYKRNLGTEIGSWLHMQIENQLLNKVPDLSYMITNNRTPLQYKTKLRYLENYKIQITKYLEWQSKYTHIGNEIIVGNKTYSGQIDELNVECIHDYKNDLEIKYENSWSNWKGVKTHKKMLGPLSDLDDCNWNKYCLQISMYHHLLPEVIKEKFTEPNKVIKFDRFSQDYQTLILPDMRNRIKEIL
jgi:hypothetical protein